MMVGLIYYRKSKTERTKEKMTNLWICQGFSCLLESGTTQPKRESPFYFTMFNFIVLSLSRLLFCKKKP